MENQLAAAGCGINVFLQTFKPNPSATEAFYQRSGYNDLKSLPKNPTISHFRELIKHHDWLNCFGDLAFHLRNISTVKLKQFAEQARSLDASNLRDFSPSKRYTLMLCLIHQAQTREKDALAITFCKTIFKMHSHAKERLENLKEAYEQRTQELLIIFSGILGEFKTTHHSPEILKKVANAIDSEGGAETLQADCKQAIAFNSNDYLPLLNAFYKSKRATLFRLLQTLSLRSSTQENLLTTAMDYIIEHMNRRSEYLLDEVDLSFTTNTWQKLIIKKEGGIQQLHRHSLELCILSHVANELRSGDLFIVGAEFYADYRKELLSWDVCETILDEHCRTTNIATNGYDFVKKLKEWLSVKAKTVDASYSELTEFIIDASGNPILKKRGAKRKPSSAVWLEKMIKAQMPERNLIDVLCSSHFYCGWAYELGPISGDDPKIDNPIARYILTNFAYATGLGPAQTSQHVRDSISAHMISWINRRHVTPAMLDKARTKLINLINAFKLTKSWGEGNSVSGDGTLHELREQNIIAEFHMRYQKKGGIAYHHVADNYILLFSTFMPCGVWEAVEIIEGLLKNDSDVQPDIIHGDTQAQSTIVFALAYLLGFRLMPRMRNWKDLKLFRPDKNTTYEHIDTLFSDSINWDLIEKHWQDMMQVVLSIHQGKMSSSVLLKKLGNYSRKNRLYQAFQELGRVIRTIFLLEYISDVELRETITAQTNKVEAYNYLSDWCFFGSTKLVASNDDIEMEKAIKYNDILTSAIMLQNVADMTEIISHLKDEGHVITKEDMSYLSPYLTENLKRFGDIVMDTRRIPKSVDRIRSKVLW
jgi:TnpA family transposase